MLSEIEYPHWLMIAGAALVVSGFIGFVFRKKTSVENDPKQEVPPSEQRTQIRSRLFTREPPELPEDPVVERAKK
jgi:LPXTG-motif cell wall-anchored protein